MDRSLGEAVKQALASALGVPTAQLRLQTSYRRAKGAAWQQGYIEPAMAGRVAEQGVTRPERRPAPAQAESQRAA